MGEAQFAAVTDEGRALLGMTDRETASHFYNRLHDALTERDQAIRERDEARARLARIVTLVEHYLRDHVYTPPESALGVAQITLGRALGIARGDA